MPSALPSRGSSGLDLAVPLHTPWHWVVKQRSQLIFVIIHTN